VTGDFTVNPPRLLSPGFNWTINDDLTGRAPDLGAYERDRPLPHYGPR